MAVFLYFNPSYIVVFQMHRTSFTLHSFRPFQLHSYILLQQLLLVSLCPLQRNLRDDANKRLHNLIREDHIQDIVSGYFDHQCSFQYSNFVICGDTSTCILFGISIYFVFSLHYTSTFSTAHVQISRTSLNFFFVHFSYKQFYSQLPLAIALVHLQQNQEAQRDQKSSPLDMVAMCENYIQRLRSLAVEVRWQLLTLFVEHTHKFQDAQRTWSQFSIADLPLLNMVVGD